MTTLSWRNGACITSPWRWYDVTLKYDVTRSPWRQQHRDGTTTSFTMAIWSHAWRRDDHVTMTSYRCHNDARATVTSPWRHHRRDLSTVFWSTGCGTKPLFCYIHPCPVCRKVCRLACTRQRIYNRLYCRTYTRILSPKCWGWHHLHSRRPYKPGRVLVQTRLKRVIYKTIAYSLIQSSGDSENFELIFALGLQ